MSAARTKPVEARRRADLARIHIAVKELGLDRETYVAIVERVGDVQSSADLDERGRRLLIEELGRLRSKAVDRQRTSSRVQRMLEGAPKELRDDVRPMVGKVEALLADAKRPWAYAHGLAKRMFHVVRVEWLRPDQLHKLIAALEYDRRRRAKRAEPR